MPDTHITPALTAEVSNTLTIAKDFRIVTPDQYADAGTKLTLIKGLGKKIEDHFDPHIKRAFEAHRALVADKKQAMAPLGEAENLIKRQMLGFQQEQERKAREEQARLEEQARKERERLEARAAKAEEKGKAEKAEDLRMQAATIATPVVAVQTPKVAGISTRTAWDFEIVDESLIPRKYLVVDRQKIAGVVRALKTETGIPGIRVFQSTSLAARGK